MQENGCKSISLIVTISIELAAWVQHKTKIRLLDTSKLVPAPRPRRLSVRKTAFSNATQSHHTHNHRLITLLIYGANITLTAIDNLPSRWSEPGSDNQDQASNNAESSPASRAGSGEFNGPTGYFFLPSHKPTPSRPQLHQNARRCVLNVNCLNQIFPQRNSVSIISGNAIRSSVEAETLRPPLPRSAFQDDRKISTPDNNLGRKIIMIQYNEYWY